MQTIPHSAQDIPYVTTEMMVEVDRAMIEDYGIDLIQMMENAGRNLAHVARSVFLEGDPLGKRVVVMAGPGGNGGGALVCARRLHNWGADVQVVLGAEEERFNEVPAHQLRIAHQMKIPVTVGVPSPFDRLDLIVDGLIGYSLRGAPRGVTGDLILWSKGMGSPILSLDVPSGVDSSTGSVFHPAVVADATMTLALPKSGLRAAKSNVGVLYLADISVPPALYRTAGIVDLEAPLFAGSDVVRLW